MVKGVTRRIVEIRETGSGYFERAIFFVRTEHRGTSENALSDEARRIIDRFAGDMALEGCGGRRRKLTRIALICLSLLLAAAVGAVAALLAVHAL